MATINQHFKLLHKLSTMLQASIDPTELQDVVVQCIVQQLGYQHAIIGLHDEASGALTGWLRSTISPTDESTSPTIIAHTDVVPLNNADTPLNRAIHNQQLIEVLDGQPPTNFTEINCRLVSGPHYALLPLQFANNLIGVIVLDGLPNDQPLSETDRLVLQHLATYTAFALGGVRACQRDAVIAERNRIAGELHDNVSQALYGLAYGLDACRQMVADTPAVAQTLTNLHATALDAQAQMRNLIFDMRSAVMTADNFVAGLHRHLRVVSPTVEIDLRIDLPGQFDHWPETVRAELYRVAQEALSNAARHAQPNYIIIKLNQTEQAIELRVADDGEGFDPTDVDQANHFGLDGMSRRIESIGGQFEVNSMFGEGTSVTVKVPLTEG